MTSLEQAFTHTEQSADAALKSAQSVVTAARALSKAAKQGDFARMKSSMARLDSAVNALGEATDDALDSWSFQDGDEALYLEEEYTAELLSAARDKGLQMYERDGNLIAYPSIVRILPSDRAVRVDRKKVSAIRPSGLVDQLLKNQQKPHRVSMPYLNSLYNVYTELVSQDGSGRMTGGGSGRVLPLARVYRMLTALPGVSRDYDRSAFARDIYTIETEGPAITRRGARVDFPSSTGTRARRRSDVFTFIGPDGNSVEYYGIRFTEEG